MHGWKTGRVHYFFSDLERNFFLMTEWSDIVTDIREQFPLRLSKTLSIAEALNVRHHGHHGRPIVPTTDFVLTLKGGKLIARSIKMQQDVMNQRVMEKFRIEQRYWEDEGVDYGMVTEEQIGGPFVRNMLWLHEFRELDGYDVDTEIVRRVAECLHPLISKEELPLNMLALRTDDRIGFPPGTCLTVVKYLLANKVWQADMARLIDPSEPLVLVPSQDIRAHDIGLTTDGGSSARNST